MTVSLGRPFQRKHRPLMADGSYHKVLCGYFEDLGCASGNDGINSYGANSIEYPSPYPSRNTNNFVVVDTTNKHSTKICNHNEMSAAGIPVGKFISDISESDGVAKPSAGKAYRIFNAKHKSFSEPFHVKSVEDDNGLTKVMCAHSPDGTEGKPIFLNPDYDDADKCDRVFGKYCMFVEVSFTNHTHYTSFDTDVAFGSQDALTMAIFDDG